MKEKDDILNKILVIKRNTRRVVFDGRKIAIAIKKGFDNTDNSKYTDKDVNNVYLKVIEKIEKRAMSRSDSIANKEFIGLMLFVAIPLPGTGAWTGALIAALLQFNRKKSFMYICIGVLIAASLVTLGVYGVIGSLV